MALKKRKDDLLLFGIFISILLFSPLAFGTVELWSLCLVEIGIVVLALLLIRNHFAGKMEFVNIPGLLPLFLLIVVMILQLVPLPPALLALVSPGASDVYQPAQDIAVTTKWFPVSVNPKATLLEAIRISSYALLYIITVQLLTSGRLLQRAVAIITGLAIGISFLAILQKMTSENYIYWFRYVSDTAKPMGPWINPSQYSGFILMLMPFILGLALYYRPRFSEDESIRVKIVSFFTSSGSSFQLFLSFGLILVLVSVLLGLSRGGMFITVLSLLIFFLLLSLKREYKIWPVLVLVLGSVVFFFITFGLDELSFKFSKTFSNEGEWNIKRIDIWLDTIEIIKTYWFTGSGFGTFVDVYPLYKTIEDTFIYDHAHNEYLELITDGGLISLILAGWFVVSVIHHGWKKVKKRRDHYCVLLSISGIVGICSMLLYSITEFNMRNGANGLYFFIVCGFLVSTANTRFHYHSRSTLLPLAPEKGSKLFLGTSVCLAIAIMVFPVRTFWAKYSYGDVKNVYFSRQLSQEILESLTPKVERMSFNDPLEATYHMVLGDIFRYRLEKDKALEHYEKAAFRNPLRGEILQRVALILPEEREELAAKLMEMSYKRSLKKNDLLLSYAEWLFWRGEKELAVDILAEGMKNHRKVLTDALPLMLSNNLTNEELEIILPPEPDVWVTYGDLLESMGQVEESAFFRKKALDFVEDKKNIKSSWYRQLYDYYRRYGRLEESIDVLRTAVVKVPHNSGFHILLGDYYKSRGIFYRAREEYEQALVFEPENEVIIKRLENLTSQ